MRMAALVVPANRAGEVARFSSELAQPHWLGHGLVGETMRSVATEGSVAVRTKVRDERVSH